MRISNFRSRFFDPAVRAAGLGHLHLTPHKLRHTAAWLAIASGADVNVIQTVLGPQVRAPDPRRLRPPLPRPPDKVSDKMDERRAMLLAKAKYGTVDAEREALKAKLAEARSMSSWTTVGARASAAGGDAGTGRFIGNITRTSAEPLNPVTLRDIEAVGMGDLTRSPEEPPDVSGRR